TEFIGYFENEDNSFYRHSQDETEEEELERMLLISYDIEVMEFVSKFWESNISMDYYMDYLDQHMGNYGYSFQTAVEQGDYELLRAVLTYLIRQERFRSGVWATAIDERLFLTILKRLEDMNEGGH
ncbi:MAG: DUF6508 domain-containing protein, partial [Clostridia bacterium]